MNAQTKLNMTIDRIEGAYAKATIRAYKADVSEFIIFCDREGLDALPSSPIAVASFINYLVERRQSSASIRRAVAAIATIHTLNHLTNPISTPEVKIEMRRMHRKIGRHSRQALGITREILNDMLGALKDDSLRSLRDKAILMVAYDTMCRRSELVDLEISDISKYSIQRESYVNKTSILVRKSKTDQEANGRWMTISEQTSAALEKWITSANIKQGKLFRGIDRNNCVSSQLTSSHISRIYKKIAKQAGFKRDLIERISGHSTRVGAAQDLLLSGASLAMIMTKGRWLKSDTVMRYVEKIGIPI